MKMKNKVMVMVAWKVLVHMHGVEGAAQYLEDKAVRDYGFEHPTTIKVFQFTEEQRRKA